MTPRTLTLTCALLAPSLASAGNHVAWQVPERRVAQVEDHELHTLAADASVLDHEMAVERRRVALDKAREARAEARDARGEAREDRRMARKDLRQDRRDGLDLNPATDALAEAERGVLEARDGVRLQKARVAARKQHIDLERARYARARGEQELTEAQLLQEHAVKGARWHRTARYTRQLARLDRRVQDEHAAWDLARVDVRERNQDYDRADASLAWATPDLPGIEGQDPEVVGMTAPADLRRVDFALGSADLDTAALNDLAWNAWVLRRHHTATVRIEGHTDATGTMAFNRELAWERAEAIEAFLLENGVWDDQLEVAAFGETALKVQTPEASAVNRQAEFRVIHDADGLVDGTHDDLDEGLAADLDR